MAAFSTSMLVTCTSISPVGRFAERFRIALYDFPGYGHHEFAADFIGNGQSLAGEIRVKHDLHDAAAIAKIDEQHAPKSRRVCTHPFSVTVSPMFAVVR